MKLLKRIVLFIMIFSFFVNPISVYSIENNNSNDMVEEESEKQISEEPIVSEEIEEIGEEPKEEIPTESQGIKTGVYYSTHVQFLGWQKTFKNGEMAGTSGKSLRLEGIKIELRDKEYEGDIEYRTHIENYGWEQNCKKNGEMSGTSGKSLRLEAIQIRLTGEMAEHYDVYYRVHSQNFGWLGWAKNYEEAGTAGYGWRLEAIEIKLVEKNNPFPDYGVKKAYHQKEVLYSAHVENLGWQDYKYDGQMAGTTGKSFRIEGLKIRLDNQRYPGNIEYRTYVQNSGWQNYVRNNQLSGTYGKSLRLEAIQIRLTGEMAEHYDVYYRVHAQNFGWLDWTKNDGKSGTIGYGFQLEGIEIKLVEKNGTAPGNTTRPFINRLVKYNAYQNNKWQSYTYDGTILGRVGYPLEAIKIGLIKDDIDGRILYSSYIYGSGWQNYVSNDTNSNSTNKTIEAIKIKLDGNIANYYDVYYSAYVSNIGWLDWAKNDQACGNIGFGKSIQSIKIKLVEKNSNPPGNTTNIYSEDELRVEYNSYVVGSKWQGYKTNGQTSGTTGQSKNIQGIKVRLNKKTISGNIMYSTQVATVGWTNFVYDDNQSGTIGKNIEAIKIKLTGELANRYDIYYRLHVSNVGWMGWASNGNPAGTAQAGLGAEAIEIKIVEKGGTPPENTSDTVTTSAFLSARWEVGSDGYRYFYDIFGNVVKGGSYTIGSTTHYFGPTGIYLGTQNLQVLDISAHNGVIDWQRVASSGVYGVILRVAASAMYRDSRLKENVAGCKKYGIPYGIYIYSYAENYSEGVAYANFTKSLINEFGMNPTLGIFLDLESNNITQFMGPTEYTAVINGFYSVIPNAEVYTYTNYANTSLNTTDIRNKITWIADYRGYCGYTGSYRMWQYTSTAGNAGVNGNVDKSILYSFR